MSNISFCFRPAFLLSARSCQGHATSCSSLVSHHRVNNKCNRVKGRCWRLLIYALHNFLLRNNMFSKRPPLFLKVSQIPQKNTCVGIFLKKLQACRPISCLFFLCTRSFMLITSNTIVCINTSMDFRKLIYENLEREKKHFTTNISIYTGHRHFDVL